MITSLPKTHAPRKLRRAAPRPQPKPVAPVVFDPELDALLLAIVAVLNRVCATPTKAN